MECKHITLIQVANMKFKPYQCQECKELFQVTLEPAKRRVPNKPPAEEGS